MAGRSVNVAIVGLGFGAEFIPIYQRHPGAKLVAICRRNRKGLDAVGDAFGVERRYTDYERLLADPDVDAVHINSPIPDHAWMTMQGAEGGKARRLHGADGDDDRRREADRRAHEANRAPLHDDGDGRLQPRVPLAQAAVRGRRTGQAPVPAGEPPAGHGRLARLLARPAADVVCDPLRGTDARAHRRHGGVRLVLRLRDDPEEAGLRVRVAVRRRERSRQAPGLRPRCADLPLPVRHGAPVPRVASTSTARSARSSGRSSRASGTSCTRRSCRRRRSRRVSGRPTSPLGCPPRSAASRRRVCTTSRSTRI